MRYLEQNIWYSEWISKGVRIDDEKAIKDKESKAIIIWKFT